MTRAAERHARQLSLVEIGSEGLARLGAGEVYVGGESFVAEIEARYLAGAGVGSLVVADATAQRAALAVDPAVRVAIDASRKPPERPLPFEVGDAHAREVARGAYAALVAMRTLLAGGAR